jgi:uncharacterized repeat protein (TIGR01451 family)
MRKVLRAGLIAVAGAVVCVSTGCQSTKGTDESSRTFSSTMPTASVSGESGTGGSSAATAPLFAKLGSDRMVRGSIAYPTGDVKTSALVLEKAVPSEVVANKPYEYELRVANVSKGKLENVTIVETIPAGIKLADKVDGAAMAVADGKATIKVGTLEAGESKTFKVGATATQAGAATNCATVTYDSSLCIGVNVVSPTLAITKTLPSEVIVCDKVPLKITLTNNGTGTARNVKLEDKLPEGMLTADGKPVINMNLGDLAAGETKAIELPLKLTKPGQYTNTATATADDGLKSEATANLAARQAVLEVVKAGPKQTYVGVPYGYDITVSNKGDADAKNVVVTDTLPAGVSAMEASDGGKIENGKVTWTLSQLDKATAKQLKLTVRGVDVGNARNTVSAQSDCAATATVAADTQLVGIPAILLEVIDNPDPVMVGGETTYTIAVTNQGSAVATNVKLVAELEAQMEHVASQGATAGKLDGAKISFEPLATLAPKAKAIYTVKVKAKDAGDVRFKTTMTSDQLGRPVEELESTTFYK